MNQGPVVPSAPNSLAANVCVVCRSQKRKCDKKLPSCTRCARLKLECNYNWYIAEQHTRTFQPLKMVHKNIQSRGLDIDRYLVGVVMTALAEQATPLDKILAAYFCDIQPWLPVVRESTFRRRLSQLGSNPRAETALVFLAVFLNMKGGETKGPNAGYQSQLYYLSSYLFSFLQLVRGPSVELVQAGLLLSLYELGSGRSQEASLRIGSCARLGYVLGLNIDTPQVDNDIPSWVRSEERRRVWLGLFMLDRLVCEVVKEFQAPYAVEEPGIHFRLPVDDQVLEQVSNDPSQLFFQPSFSTPLDIPVSYFGREIQGTSILGQVQGMRKMADANAFLQKASALDGLLIGFLKFLFEQSPRGWEVLCGANATALMAALTLHKNRIVVQAYEAIPNQLDMLQVRERSLYALISIINMVLEICSKFNALDRRNRINWVPLPAVVCTGEAALIAIWVNEQVDRHARIDYQPLQQTLVYASRSWAIAEDYLQQISQALT